MRLMIVVLALLCAACDPSTRLVSTWQDPQYKAGPVSNVAVFVLAKDPGMRRITEDELVKRLPEGSKGTPSYSFLPQLPDDRELVAARIKELGFDSVLVIQLARLEKDEVYTPPTVDYVAVPTYYRGFGSYYGYAYQQVYSPGYVSEVTTAVVDSALYAVGHEGPLWLGTTSTYGASADTSSARSVARKVTAEITKRNLLVNKKAGAK